MLLCVSCCKLHFWAFLYSVFPGKYQPGRGALPGGKLGSPSSGWERRNDIIKVGKRGSEPHYCSVGPTRAEGGGRVAAEDPIERELAPTSSRNSTGDAAVERSLGGWDDHGKGREGWALQKICTAKFKAHTVGRRRLEGGSEEGKDR